MKITMEMSEKKWYQYFLASDQALSATWNAAWLMPYLRASSSTMRKSEKEQSSVGTGRSARRPPGAGRPRGASFGAPDFPPRPHAREPMVTGVATPEPEGPPR